MCIENTFNSDDMNSRRDYTTEEVGRICKVSSQIILKCAKNKSIRAYTVPSANKQWRIPRKCLVEFMKKYEIPLRFLDENPDNREKSYVPRGAAKMLRIPAQTVVKMVDSGELEAYHVPNSRHRKIPYTSIIKFAKKYGLTEQVADYFGCSAEDL